MRNCKVEKFCFTWIIAMRVRQAILFRSGRQGRGGAGRTDNKTKGLLPCLALIMIHNNMQFDIKCWHFNLDVQFRSHFPPGWAVMFLVCRTESLAAGLGGPGLNQFSAVIRENALLNTNNDHSLPASPGYRSAQLVWNRRRGGQAGHKISSQAEPIQEHSSHQDLILYHGAYFWSAKLIKNVMTELNLSIKFVMNKARLIPGNTEG